MPRNERSLKILWHELKTDPEPFNAVFFGFKTYEIRLNDRSFRLGDYVVLRETVSTGEQMTIDPEGRRVTEPLEYTGRVLSFQITEVRTGYGIKDGWCILGLKSIPI